MDAEDLVFEALKNSLEAGAENIDIYISGASLKVVDDGKMEALPSFKDGESSKGEKRGRGLFLLYEMTKGRLKIERLDKISVLSAEFDSPLKAENVIPICFNLTDKLTYHSLKGESESYYINKDILAELGIDRFSAVDLARLKRIIREKEQRSL